MAADKAQDKDHTYHTKDSTPDQIEKDKAKDKKAKQKEKEAKDQLPHLLPLPEELVRAVA